LLLKHAAIADALGGDIGRDFRDTAEGYAMIRVSFLSSGIEPTPNFTA
jgi:hypothetical protein